MQPVENHVFDAADAGVSPALLVRPHLPTRSPLGIPPEKLGRLEIIVSESGEVERVRLVGTTPERQLHDFMLVAAAKAWVFAPAHRNGVPVRYRLQVLLTN